MTNITANDDGNKIDQTCIFSNSIGKIGFSGNMGKLMKVFDREFLKIAYSVGAVEEFYPVLLNLETLKKTGYLRRSPHHCIFCSSLRRSENIIPSVIQCHGQGGTLKREQSQDPDYVLSPSACFHVYEHYQGKTLPNQKVITLKQNVFRDESEVGWLEVGRLRDYRIREIVFIGNEEFVEKKRQTVMDKTIEFVIAIGMNYQMELATDVFTLPEMKRFEKIQVEKKSKYELLFESNDRKKIAAASFNLHEAVFTKSFGINVRNIDKTVTGCVGYGLERWVLAFFHQFGYEKDKWPEMIQEKLRDEDERGNSEYNY